MPVTIFALLGGHWVMRQLRLILLHAVLLFQRQREPFIIRHRNETHTWYTGLCMDVLDILTTALNFTYVNFGFNVCSAGHRLQVILSL